MPDGTAYYYHYDSRGSTIALTDAGQNVTDAYAYDPFGRSVNSTGATANPFRYVGRYGVMEEGNGLQFMRARYYDPEIGRFLSKDPIPPALGDIETINLYAYVKNNPIILIDPMGLWWEELKTGVLYAVKKGAYEGIKEAAKYIVDPVVMVGAYVVSTAKGGKGDRLLFWRLWETLVGVHVV